MLRVGRATETVEVSADSVQSLQTMSASLAAISRGVVGPGKKSQVTIPNCDALVFEQTMTPRLRHVFEETAYLAPSLETDKAGRAGHLFKQSARAPESYITARDS
jgi:hypothetical protein